MGLHGKSRFDSSGSRLIVVVAAIFVLASLIVVLRSTLFPAGIRDQPAWSGQPQASPLVPSCAAGPECARDEATTTTPAEPEARLVDLVMARRGRSGCPALQLNDRLMASARAQADDMASRAFAAITNPDHEGPDARARKVGYRGSVIEIVAAGLPTADEVFAQWTNPHNPAAAAVTAKMTDCSRVSAGVAYHPGRVKPTFGEGIWVLDMGDT